MANQIDNRQSNQERNSGSVAKGSTQETARNLNEQARDQAQQAAHQAQDRALSAVEERKQRAADELNDVAQAFRQTGDRLRDQNNEMAARYTETVADQVERFSGYLHNNDVEQFLNDAENLARRQPELFLGGAFTLGLLAARFFKSSSPSRSYGRTYDRSARSYPGRRWEYERYNPEDWERGGWREERGYRTSPSGTRQAEDYPTPTGATTRAGTTTRPEAAATGETAAVGRNAGVTAGTSSSQTTSSGQTTSRRTFDEESGEKTEEK